MFYQSNMEYKIRIHKHKNHFTKPIRAWNWFWQVRHDLSSSMIIVGQGLCLTPIDNTDVSKGEPFQRKPFPKTLSTCLRWPAGSCIWYICGSNINYINMLKQAKYSIVLPKYRNFMVWKPTITISFHTWSSKKEKLIRQLSFSKVQGVIIDNSKKK